MKTFGPLVRVIPSTRVSWMFVVQLKIHEVWEDSAFTTLESDAIRIAQDLRRKLLEGENV